MTESDPKSIVCQALPEMAPLDSITKEKIEESEGNLMRAVMSGELSEVDCPLIHTFAPGVYIREIFMPAGSLIIGHEHKTKHANIVLSGSAYVMMDGKPFTLTAPFTFVSEPGVRKVLFILSDMRYATVHPTDETDLDKLAEMLIVKSPTHQAYIGDIKKLAALFHENE